MIIKILELNSKIILNAIKEMRWYFIHVRISEGTKREQERTLDNKICKNSD